MCGDYVETIVVMYESTRLEKMNKFTKSQYIFEALAQD
jgi:hypothetical protein